MRIIRTYADLLALGVGVDDRFPSSSSQTGIRSPLGVLLDYSNIEPDVGTAGLGYATEQGQKCEKQRKLHVDNDSGEFAQIDQARFVEDQLRKLEWGWTERIEGRRLVVPNLYTCHRTSTSGAV